jgi:uncharacterized protein YecT (DUF1311 family)
VISLLIAAAAATVSPNCDSESGGDIAVSECWGNAYEVADAELNLVWPKVLTAARASDKEFESTPRRNKPSAEADLLKAQKHWIAWRDAECAARSDWAQGGSLQNVISSKCAHDLTRDRIDQFQQLLSNFTES